jgi:hypothetical protein
MCNSFNLLYCHVIFAKITRELCATIMDPYLKRKNKMLLAVFFSAYL